MTFVLTSGAALVGGDLTSDPDGFRAAPAEAGGPGVDLGNALPPQVTGAVGSQGLPLPIQLLLWPCRPRPSACAVPTAASAGASPPWPPRSTSPPDAPHLPSSLVFAAVRVTGPTRTPWGSAPEFPPCSACPLGNFLRRARPRLPQGLPPPPPPSVHLDTVTRALPVPPGS